MFAVGAVVVEHFVTHGDEREGRKAIEFWVGRTALELEDGEARVGGWCCKCRIML